MQSKFAKTVVQQDVKCFTQAVQMKTKLREELTSFKKAELHQNLKASIKSGGKLMLAYEKELKKASKATEAKPATRKNKKDALPWCS